jgi:predicted RNase H-like HicB family nuclease
MVSTTYKILMQWDPDDQVWVTHVPALNYISTFGDSREETLENTKEAIVGYLEASADFARA